MRPGPRGGLFASEPSPFVRLGHQVLALKHEGVRAADCLQVRDALERGTGEARDRPGPR